MKTISTVALAILLAACRGDKRAPTERQPAEPQPKGARSESAPVPELTAQAFADSIMAQWQRAHVDRNWEEEVRRAHPNIPAPANNESVVGVGEGQGEGQTYGRFTEQDIVTWERETNKLVLAGARIFRDANELGSTVAVSCDMCHPDAANTHPETYPKFQVQMGRVALLRDMINWCLINPLRAPAMKPDDFRMRALEAYMMAERKGTRLEYGKH